MKFLLGLLFVPGIVPMQTSGTVVKSLPSVPRSTADSAAARECVVLINRERARHDLPPLKWQPTLCNSAQWLAQDMAAHDYFSHTDRTGRDIDPRLPDLGYTPYSAIGENIAAGQQNAAAAVAAWLKSPGHCENILSRDWSETGGGYVVQADSKFRFYWVQDFGRRRDVFPVVINNEEPETDSPKVRLTIYGAGWAQQMRVSNDGAHWTDWQPYQSALDWQLEEGSGERTVIVEVRRGSTVRRNEDTVVLLPQDIAASKSKTAEAR